MHRPLGRSGCLRIFIVAPIGKYVWSDGNLSNDYFWCYPDRCPARSGRPPATAGSAASRVSMPSRSRSTPAAPELSGRLFDLLATLRGTGMDLYAYATFTGPTADRIRGEDSQARRPTPARRCEPLAAHRAAGNPAIRPGYAAGHPGPPARACRPVRGDQRMERRDRDRVHRCHPAVTDNRHHPRQLGIGNGHNSGNTPVGTRRADHSRQFPPE